MDFAEKYVKRVNFSGATYSESFRNQSKMILTEQIVQSPDCRYVQINNNTELSPCIVKDLDGFTKRKFSFIPDTKVNNGDYILYDGFTYLAVKQNYDDAIPYLTTEICNEIFSLTIEGTEEIVDYDDFGRPIHESTDDITYNIPCVLTTKIYSTVDNSPIPLPDGSIMIKMPYKIGQIPPINYIFTYHNDPYKVSTIDYDNVINGIGFIEMRLQRFTGGEP